MRFEQWHLSKNVKIRTALATGVQLTSKQPIMTTALLEDLCSMIEKTRHSISSAINASLTLLYWHVGDRIRKEILQETRAEYGPSIVATIGTGL